MRKRFFRDEMGFTLTEMMVTIIIMTIVLFALYSIFDMTLKVFSTGNNKVEATESARIGMEKMEREIRQAYKYNNTTASQTHLFFNAATATTPLTVPPTTRPDLTFGNELGSPGDGQITCATPSSCEYITYKLTNANGTTPCSEATCTLWRENGSKSGPVVDNVVPGSLSFTFLKSDGTPLDLAAGDGEDDIGIVLVSLDVIVNRGIGNDGKQELTSIIDLRNRQ